MACVKGGQVGGGGMGVEGEWAGGEALPIGLFGVAMSPRSSSYTRHRHT